MANSSAKRIAQDNTKYLKFLQLGFILVHFLYTVFRFAVFFSSVTTFHMMAYGTTSAISLFLFGQLHSMGSPEFDKKGQLLRSGQDLSAPGLTEYIFDVIYVTWAVQLGSLLSDTIWYFYVVIPGFAFYKAWVSFIWPYLQSRSSSTGAAAGAGKSKRQEKREKQQNKVKYMR